MKLQNKKTGEIGYLIAAKGHNYTVTNDNWDDCGEYNSLAELNEEWDDYKEPKEVYYIDYRGYIYPESSDGVSANEKEIGNYFETREEAEKAVEKLKAWKRLKDKGFRFEGLTLSGWGCPCIEYKVDGGISDSSSDMQVREDLALLFGGEE